MAACNNLLDSAGIELGHKPEATTPPRDAQEGGPAAAHPIHATKPAVPANAAEIADIQSLLTKLDYNPGPVDGIMGPRTKAAIKKYQAATGLPDDGMVSTALASNMRRDLEAGREKAEPRTSEAAAQPAKVALAKPGATDLQGASETIQAREPVADPVPGEGTQTLSKPDTAEPAINPLHGNVEEPYYEAGDSYIYSSGLIETATRVEGRLVHWVSNDGVRYKAGANFVLPPVEWKGKDGSVQLIVTASSDRNWPPAAASRLVILATPAGPNVGQSVTETWSGEWTCGTEGRSNIAVPAGRFDVIKIDCERTGGTPGRPHRRVWYYAPDIHHYVRKEETPVAGGQPKVADLIAVWSGRASWSRSARSGFNWAIQKLLERGEVGQTVAWEIGDSGVAFDIALAGETKTAADVTCRRYKLVRRKPGRLRRFPALACRDDVTGQWKIPGFEKGSILPADVLASR